MLVLTRKAGQEIVIGGGIRITIVAVTGDRVRIGITAPPEVRVDRDEVHRRVREFGEQKRSSGGMSAAGVVTPAVQQVPDSAAAD